MRQFTVTILEPYPYHVFDVALIEAIVEEQDGFNFGATLTMATLTNVYHRVSSIAIAPHDALASEPNSNNAITSSVDEITNDMGDCDLTDPVCYQFFRFEADFSDCQTNCQ